MIKQNVLLSVAALFASCAENYRKLDPESAEFKSIKQEVEKAILVEDEKPVEASKSDFETSVLEKLEGFEDALAAIMHSLPAQPEVQV